MYLFIKFQFAQLYKLNCTSVNIKHCSGLFSLEKHCSFPSSFSESFAWIWKLVMNIHENTWEFINPFNNTLKIKLIIIVSLLAKF